MHSKLVPLLASAWLLTFSLQNSSAIPIIYTVGAGSSVSANRSEPSLGINTALISNLSATSFTLDETGRSSIRPAERFRADRQGGMALSYGQSFSLSPSRTWTNESLLDAKDFVPKDITATLDFSNPGPQPGLTGSASQGNGTFGRTVTLEQTNVERGVVDLDSPAPTFVLTDQTITIEPALNTEARPKDNGKGSDPVVEVPKDKDKDKYKGPIASVPEHCSTAMLLGTAILVLSIVRHRFSNSPS
jgi:hypothetical protein